MQRIVQADKLKRRQYMFYLTLTDEDENLMMRVAQQHRDRHRLKQQKAKNCQIRILVLIEITRYEILAYVAISVGTRLTLIKNVDPHYRLRIF